MSSDTPIKILRFGILSTASIVNKLLPAFTACNTPFTTTTTTTTDDDQQYQIQLVAVASRSLDKAKEFATLHGIEHAYGSYEELLSSPQIDAVYIPLPNTLHKEWAIKAVQAGKHVLVEKPITLSVKDSIEIEEELKKSAPSSGLVVMEGFMAVHLQQTQQVVDAILSGVIGDIEGFYGTFTFPNVRLSGRDAPAKEGGGSLWDIGCYPIAVTRCILSALNRARCQQQNVAENDKKNSGADDYTCIAASVSGVATQVGSVIDGKVVLEAVSSTADWFRYHDRCFGGTVHFQPGSGVVVPRNALNGWDGDANANTSATAPVPTLQFTSGFNGFLRRQLIIQGTLGRISINNAYHGTNTDSFTIEQCGTTPAATRAEWAAANMRGASTTTVTPRADCPPCIYTSQLQNFASRAFSQSNPSSSSVSCADLLTMPFSRGNVAVIEALYRSAAEGGRSVVVTPEQ